MEQERVPKHKEYRFSTRENSDYKWHQDQRIVGALEVKSQPLLQLKEEFQKKYVKTKEDQFGAYLTVWETQKLRSLFLQACENVPPAMSCCGLVYDNDSTLIEITRTLNKHWVKQVNEALLKEGQGFKIDLFVWCWNNPMGKAQTSILLIRFHEIPTVDQAASKNGTKGKTRGGQERPKSPKRDRSPHVRPKSPSRSDSPNNTNRVPAGPNFPNSTSLVVPIRE